MVRVISQGEQTQVKLRTYREHGVGDPRIVIVVFQVRRGDPRVVR